MSIIYKGLNPKNHYGLCILTINGELITADGKHYQAIQIPTPHGRLGDLDVLLEESLKEGAYNYVDSWQIAEQPTILEAEEE